MVPFKTHVFFAKLHPTSYNRFEFTRNNILQDECSFVSLRDVERVLEVMSWFYSEIDDGRLPLDNFTESEEEDDGTRQEQLVGTFCIL